MADPQSLQPSAASHSAASHSAEHQDLASDAVPPPPAAPELPRSCLTASLLGVVLIPLTIALSVWYFIPAVPEPVLPARIEYRPVAWPQDGSAPVELVPALTVTNPTDQPWQNISLAINKRFYFYYPESLPAGASCDIPLFLFRTSGNQAFRPQSQEIQLLTVYAQLPNGGRAILEQQHIGPRRKSPDERD
jgi:hypothetical protein